MYDLSGKIRDKMKIKKLLIKAKQKQKYYLKPDLTKNVNHFLSVFQIVFLFLFQNVNKKSEAFFVKHSLFQKLERLTKNVNHFLFQKRSECQVRSQFSC